METKEGDREEDQHHVMRSTHPYPFQEVVSPKKETGLCSVGKDKSVHSCMQSTLDDDVSLHGGMASRRPINQ